MVRPERAYADVYDLSETITSCYVRLTNKGPSTFTTSDITISPIASGRRQSMDSLIVLSKNADGTAWVSTTQSWASPNYAANKVMYQVFPIGSGTLVEGAGLQILTGFTIEFQVTPTEGASTVRKYGTTDNFKFYVAKSGLTNITEIQPDSDGIFWMPFDVGYLIVANTATGFTGLSTAYEVYIRRVGDVSLLISTIDTEMQRVVNNQTNTLMNTDGSDDMTSGVVGDVTEQYEDFTLTQMVGEVTQQIQQSITSQESDATVPFPGLQMAGFSLPATEVDVWDYLPSNLQEPLRGITTFIFCVAFLHHIYSLYQAIFGIWEYGAGAEDFGMGSYSPVRPKQWSSDYSIDEDLGF